MTEHETEREPDMMDALRPLLDLQKHFHVEWDLVSIGRHMDEVIAPDEDLADDACVALRVQVDLPIEVARLLHLARQMFAPA